MANTTTPLNPGEATPASEAEPVVPVVAAQEEPQAPLVPEIKAPEQTDHEKLLAGVSDVLKAKEEPVAGAPEAAAAVAPVSPEATVSTPAETTPVVSAVASDDDRLPFKDHPRFVELRTQATEMAAKLKQFEADVPVLQDHSQRLSTLQTFVHGNGITDVEFQEGLRIMAALKNDPLEAAKLLAPHLKNLSAFTGDGALPPDVEARVADGEISDAAARELVRARTQAAIDRVKVERMTQAGQQQATQAVVTASHNAVMAWEQKVAAADPDYTQKQELVISLIRAEAAKGAPANATEAVALAQRCYDKANSLLKPAAQMRAATKPNPSSAASLPQRSAVVAQPKSLAEGVDAALSAVAARR